MTPCVPTEPYEHYESFFLPITCPYGTKNKPFVYLNSKPSPMANTYSQLHIQLVFAVKYRAALIQKEWKERLHQYR